MTKYTALIVGLLAIVFLADVGLATPPIRMWRDDTGDFRVEGTLTSISDDASSIAIELSDGQRVDVPIGRLSSGDRRYVLRQKRLESRPKPKATLQSNVDSLYGIDWHRTLLSAGVAASGRPGKPIMCFRVLGDLAGYM